MKKLLSLILALLLLFSLSALAEPGTIFPWRQYTLDVTLVTTDPAIIQMPNAPTGGTLVMVRLTPLSGTVLAEDVKAFVGDFAFRDGDGKNWEPNGHMMSGLTQNPEGGFPTIDPEQDFFDVLFFLKGKTEEAITGAKLVVATEKEGERILVSLDKAPHELPSSQVSAAAEAKLLMEQAEALGMKLPEIAAGETLYIAATPGAQAETLMAAFVLNEAGEEIHDLVLFAYNLNCSCDVDGQHITLTGGKQTKLFYATYPAAEEKLEAGSSRLEQFTLEGDRASATLYYVCEGKIGTSSTSYRMDFDPVYLTFFGWKNP